jgi:carbon monoxide dehydrogenase subunit G
MRLDHEFTVPVPAAQAWPVLLDIDRIAPCMPGATITKVDGDDFEGTVKVKVGPITVTYGGTASFVEKDESQRMAVLEARGRETRGSGTATARVTAQIFDQGDSARVSVSTDLSITGKPAQFGRGVMNDVGTKLLGRFADCLARELGSDPAAPAAAPAGTPAASQQAGVPADAQAAAAGNGQAGGEATADPAVTATAASSAAGAAAGTGTTGTLAGTAGAEPAAPAADPGGAATTGTAPKAAPAAVLDARPEAEPIDLFEAAGGAVAKRAIPAVAAAALLAILFVVLRHRR